MEASWRWVFWINIPVGIVTVFLSLRVLPESRDETAEVRPDLLGAVLVALGAGSLALALVKAPSWGWTSKDFFELAALAVVSAIGVAVRSARHDAPVVDLRLLESRSFNGAILASIAYYAGFGAFLLNMVEFLTGVWHFSPINAGLAIAPGPLFPAKGISDEEIRGLQGLVPLEGIASIDEHESAPRSVTCDASARRRFPFRRTSSKTCIGTSRHAAS